MATRDFLQFSTVRLGGITVLGLGGLLLIGIGLGTALDYLVAQSHPVGPMQAFLLRAEYTVAGVFLLVAGGVAWKTTGTGGKAD